MDFGGFHEEEKDGNLFLEYHHPKYHPKPKTHSLSPSGEAVSDDHLLQPLFLCPSARKFKDRTGNIFPLNSSPEFVFSTRSATYHSVLPLFWCNNKEFDIDGGCNICRHSNFGTDYYFCDICTKKYHKECVESPLKIKHPYHPQHSLQLYFHFLLYSINCLCCRRRVNFLVYYCTICNVFMHPVCAVKPIPFVIDPPKRHADHPLTFFPRQTSLTCNFCGLVRKLYPTYICVRCNFVFHSDCMYSPSVIKISRHNHRISYTFSLRSCEWSCGVFHQIIDGDYGAYTCDKCGHYAVHSRCALEKNVWDGKDLEGLPDKDDITQDVGSFNIISKEVILHFLHDHHFRLEVSILYNEKKLCQACYLPIFEGNFYSCVECDDFIFHETCAKFCRILQHALHPHPLTLKAASRYGMDRFGCSSCNRGCRGFVYECCIRGCIFTLDVKCASIAEPFCFQGHKHPLFIFVGRDGKLICRVCKTERHNQLNCIKCDFIVCMKCATLPYRARYEHDKHFLTAIWEEEVREKDWCEVCERNLRDTNTKVFYWCVECCTIFHIECVLGKNSNLSLSQTLKFWVQRAQILLENLNL